jgi:maleylpyruvate isomerase
VTITLYNYWRSGPSYRTRIALELKGVAYTYAAVDLLSGAQSGAENRARHPQGFVPTLEADGVTLTQSPAILEWIDETWPTPPLLPKDAAGRARVRAMAAVIGCDIHPLNNLRIHKYLKGALGADQDAIDAWSRRWIEEGFSALERMIGESPVQGRFAYGDTPTLADLYLVPQIYSAARFKVDMSPFPRLAAIDAACAEHPAFRAAHPQNQPDAS